jgi:4a-hydroxytetrahydrobiopterin dehydratase
VKAYEKSQQVPEKSKNEGKLSDSELQSAVRKLRGWTVSKGKLHREYKFADFIHAFGFMATAAIAIQAMGHHPEWSNVYDAVTVDLTTHDAGGITNKDLELAGKLDGFAAKLM